MMLAVRLVVLLLLLPIDILLQLLESILELKVLLQVANDLVLFHDLLLFLFQLFDSDLIHVLFLFDNLILYLLALDSVLDLLILFLELFFKFLCLFNKLLEVLELITGKIRLNDHGRNLLLNLNGRPFHNWCKWLLSCLRTNTCTHESCFSFVNRITLDHGQLWGEMLALIHLFVIREIHFLS